MIMPPYFWLGLLALAAILVGVWWARTQYVSAQRRSMRAFYRLSEDMFSAPSPAEIAEKLAAMLPSITHATSVRLYLLNRRTKSLESVPTSDHPEPMAVSIEGEQDGLAAGIVRCFRSRTLVNIPDVRRNPLVNSVWKAGVPRSVMFVPLLAERETLGVMEAGSLGRLGYFTPDEQATVQHLAKQVAACLELQEQKEVREQLFRSEKLAATGQLISGVASDLRAPLDRILELSSSLEAAVTEGTMGRGLKQLGSEAQRVSEIVARLVSFARPAEAAARLVDVNALAAGLAQFREPEWKALGLRVQNRIAPDSAMVRGVPGQIEEVYLNLLVYAEQCASRTETKILELTSSRMTGRVVIEIHFPGEAAEFSVSDANLNVCRAIVLNHGGDLRIRNTADGVSFDVDFPLAPTAESRTATGGPIKPRRVQTILLVDSDLGTQRQLLGLLTARGHRVVPTSAQEAADLAHRLRFDAVVWAVRPGGAKWSDFHERLREAVPSFVLVSDGYDAEFAASLAGSGGFLLGRPIQDAELDRILLAVEARAAARV
jgi:signal transduction histidine kinase